MKINDIRLAYIKWPDGKVTIDIVTLSKRGNGFHLKEQFWHRVDWLFMPCNEGFMNENQDILRMSLLKRRSTPIWVDKNTTKVSKEAEVLYGKWIQEYTS